MAEETALKAEFDQKYQDYFGTNSQSLLPFASIEKSDWKKLQASRPLKVVFVEPDKYYNSKLYTLTMYQATDDGQYYLDVKGGFWGMDDLIYGPLSAKELQ
ncbi:MAG: hypothetical protein ACAH07_03860 [Methylophilaceae bacterium]|nr:hypothetical protein [Methyloradius sp.]